MNNGFCYFNVDCIINNNVIITLYYYITYKLQIHEYVL